MYVNRRLPVSTRLYRKRLKPQAETMFHEFENERISLHGYVVSGSHDARQRRSRSRLQRDRGLAATRKMSSQASVQSCEKRIVIAPCRRVVLEDHLRLLVSFPISFFPFSAGERFHNQSVSQSVKQPIAAEFKNEVGAIFSLYSVFSEEGRVNGGGATLLTGRNVLRRLVTNCRMNHDP